MTVATTYEWNPDLASIAKTAMRTAGVLGPYEEPSGEEQQMCGEWLNAELKSWQTAGRLLRQIERVTTTLTPGTATVPVAADTIDVEFPALVTPTSGTATYQVRRMTLDEYMAISNKTEQGYPSRALIERKDTVVMTLWPVPDANVASVTYTRARLIRDLTAGTTGDLQQRHLKTLILQLAVWLAESGGKSGDKIERLEKRAGSAMSALTADNTEKGDIRFRLR